MNKIIALLAIIGVNTSVYADTIDLKKYVMNNVPKEWTIYFDKNISARDISTKESWEITLDSLSEKDIKITKDISSKTIRFKSLNNEDSSNSSFLKKKTEKDCCLIDKAQLNKQISNEKESVVTSAKGISYAWLKDRSVSFNLRNLTQSQGYLFTDKSWQVYADGVYSDYILDTSETFTGDTLEDVYEQILGRIEYLGLKACFFENKYIKIVNRKESNGDTKCIED